MYHAANATSRIRRDMLALHALEYLLSNRLERFLHRMTCNKHK